MLWRSLFFIVLMNSLAFWSWNDKLNKNELLTQMKDLKEAGYEGFFMHSREGLESEYLSEEWLECIKFCAQEAPKIGLKAFIYDDNKWPSGMMGGALTKLHPEFAAKAIVYISETNSFELQSSNGHEWYNDNPPANNLSAQSVAKFIELTHEKYVSETGLDNIEGFFTDEPNCCDFFFVEKENRPWLPFTCNFYEEFANRRGYELDVRKLFFIEDKYTKHRHDYWRTLAELFCERYTKQYFDWCEAHNTKLFGHMLFENQLGYQTRVCGAVMPNYKYLHVPGIDLLGEQTREYLTVKQCASAAHQYGKEATISETYGCTGWGFTFEGQKRLWDWQCALGINIRSQHLSVYSLRGARKRDFPPVFSYQAESFKYNKVIEDYCSRLSAVQISGKPQRDVLVIHTISGIWCESGSTPTENLQEFDYNMGWTCEHIVKQNAVGDELNLLAEALLKNGIDFDFGDEILMNSDASVVAGKLKIALAEYSIVILPKTSSIFKSTYKLLQKFVANGGKLIVVLPYPFMLEGDTASVKIDGVIEVQSNMEAVAMADKLTARPAQMIDLHTGRTAELINVFRKTDEGFIMTAVNDGELCECLIKLHDEFIVSELDLMTGREQAIQIGEENYFYTVLIKNDCKVWYLRQGKCEKVPLQREYHDPHESEKLIAALPPAAKFRRTMPNALALDKARDFMIKELPETDMYICAETSEQIYCNGIACEPTEDFFIDKSIRKFRLFGTKQGKNSLTYESDEAAYVIGDFAVNLQREIVWEPQKLHLGDWTLQGYLHYPGSIVYSFDVFCDKSCKGQLVLGEYRATLIVVKVNGESAGHIIFGSSIEVELNSGNNLLEIEAVGSNRNIFGPFHKNYDGCSRINPNDFLVRDTEEYIVKPYGLMGQIKILEVCN